MAQHERSAFRKIFGRSNPRFGPVEAQMIVAIGWYLGVAVWEGLVGTSMVYAWGIIQAYASNAGQARADRSDAGEDVETANSH